MDGRGLIEVFVSVSLKYLMSELSNDLNSIPYFNFILWIRTDTEILTKPLQDALVKYKRQAKIGNGLFIIFKG